jgi:hypothetical protein
MQQKAPGPAARVRLLVIDSDAARLYLAGVRDLAAEAAATEDPRVIVTALRILETRMIGDNLSAEAEDHLAFNELLRRQDAAGCVLVAARLAEQPQAADRLNAFVERELVVTAPRPSQWSASGSGWYPACRSSLKRRVFASSRRS